MLEVNIEKIIPVTDARDSLNKIVDEVSASDQLYVLTVNGKPTAVVVGVKHLEKLTGTPSNSIDEMAASASANTSSETTSAPAVAEPIPAAPAPVAPAETPAPAATEPTAIPVAAEPAPTTPVDAAAPAPVDPNQFVTPEPVDLESIGSAQTPQNPVPPSL